MTLHYTIEHYMVCGLAVAVVKTPQDRLVQAWVADKSKKCMVRDGSLIDDVESDSRVRPMSKMAFDAYCAQHGIKTEIPERAIQQTLALVTYGTRAADDLTVGVSNPGSGIRYGALAIG